MSERYVVGGFCAGLIQGFGIASFWFLNPYIALMLVLSGAVLPYTALEVVSSGTQKENK